MMLEVLRGAATAALPNTFEALSALFSGLLSPLLALHIAFKHVAHVVALLLKLADDIVEALTGYLESHQQKEQLLNWVLQLLAQYRDSNLWQVSSMQVAVASRAAQRWLCLVSSWPPLGPRQGASTSTCAGVGWGWKKGLSPLPQSWRHSPRLSSMLQLLVGCV